MNRKKFSGILIITCIVVGIFSIWLKGYDSKISNLISPISLVEKVKTKIEPIPNSQYKDQDVLAIAFLGIDRRSKDETSYRTDIMIVAIANKTNKKITLVSVPRDLWTQGTRINALFVQNGWESLQQALTEITGVQPTSYIMVDFEDLVWIVDSMGGVPVNVETTFTDHQYPVDATKEYQTVSFKQGPELLTGERALIYSRSRKGDFDNGDWGRMKRQHIILQGMVNAVEQKDSVFWPMDVEKAFKLLLKQGITTNLTLDDLKFFWSYYPQRESYTVESLLVDYNYLYTPPMEEYGGAWVLIPTEANYETLHKDIQSVLAPQEELTNQQ
ncbi:MAG: LCP family protein [Patescibacteria group bacterium]